MSTPTTNLRPRAAALLEAVARDCEHAYDAEVPLRCGHAADLLGGPAGSPIPQLEDLPGPIAAAITDALALLAQLPVDALDPATVDRVTDAAAEARAALACR